VRAIDGECLVLADFCVPVQGPVLADSRRWRSPTKAHAEGRLDEKLKLYTTPRLLIIDEIGYLPIDRLVLLNIANQ